MKKVILLFTLVMMSMSFTSCSMSEVVNDAKLSTAKKIKDVVEKELNKAFISKNVSVEGVDCALEATKHSDYMYEKTIEFLKAEEKGVVKSLSSSASKGILQSACVYVVDKGLIYLIQKSGDSSLCLKELGRMEIIGLADEACAKLE